MFGQSAWKAQVLESIKQLELQLSDLKKGELELRAQNLRLSQTLKNLGKKLALRLPISLESLEKNLNYDLIFPDEIDAWRAAVQKGVVLDLRPIHEHIKNSIPGSFNIPFDQLALRLESLAKDSPILVVCENGIKSVSASELLSSKGYSFLYVLKGGMSLYRGQLESGPAGQRIAEATA